MARHKKPRTSDPDTGDPIICGLTGLRDALATGVCLPDRFTIRTVELDLEPRTWSSTQIRALRTRLKASQSVLAKLVGTNVKTIQAWEQGHTPPPMARRLLDCIAKDLSPWEKILREAAIATSPRSPGPRAIVERSDGRGIVPGSEPIGETPDPRGVPTGT